MKRILFIAGILFCNPTLPMLNAILGTTPPTKPAATATKPIAQPPIQSSTKEIVKAPAGPIAPAQAAPNPAVPLVAANQTAPVIVNVITTQSLNSNPSVISANTNLQDQQVAQEVQQTATQEVHQTLTATLTNAIKERALQTQEQLIAFKEWIGTNKYKIGLATILLSYAALVAYLVRANYRLHDETLWSRWRIEDSYEQLASMDSKKLGQDLVFAIQRRYTTGAQFTDFIQPLVKFMQDLETEKRFLKNYIFITKWIDRAYMQRIFPINEKKVKLAKKLLQRIYFFEHIFLSWAAEFKMTQNA